MSKSKEKKPEPRAYYEVWGELAGALKFHRRLNVILGLLTLLALIWSILHALKPPLVVRVDETGQAFCIENYLTKSGPSEVEVKRFVREFTRYFLEVNSTTIGADFEEAVSMMNREMADEVIREFRDSKMLAGISKSGVKSEMEVAETTCDRRNDEFWKCKMTGLMTTSSLITRKSSTRPFIVEAVLLETVRTERTPNGLLVADYDNKYLEPTDG